MKETDKEFVERVALDVQVRGDIYGFDRPRLVTLARRGADAADEIERLRNMLRFWMEAYRTHKHEPLIIAYESTLNRFPDLNPAALKEDGDA